MPEYSLEQWRDELQATVSDETYSMAPTRLLLEIVREVLSLRHSMEIMAQHVASLQPKDGR